MSCTKDRYAWRCAHGRTLSEQCLECDVQRARAMVACWGEAVDEARAVIEAAGKPKPVETPRYKVTKVSGSRYAFVIDTESGISIKRYDIFKRNGWDYADRHAANLNKQETEVKA